MRPVTCEFKFDRRPHLRWTVLLIAFAMPLSIEPQVFCLGFDNTFTGDVELWSIWVELAQERGHRVVCITGRKESFGSRRELEDALPSGVDVFFAYDQPKMDHADDKGLLIDVWIDDWPSLIVGN